MSTTTEQIKWIGSKIVSNELNRAGNFYKSVLFGETELNIDDHVLIIKSESTEESEFSCDVAKIKQLYEALDDTFKDEKHRAIVEWYSRPKHIPHRQIHKEMMIDFENEVVLDFRPFGADVSIESIFKKCNVLFGSLEQCASEMIQSSKIVGTTYVCRYVFRRLNQGQRFHLLPVMEHFKGTYDYNNEIENKKTTNVHIDLEEHRRSTPRRAAKEKSNNVYRSGSTRYYERNLRDEALLCSPRTPRRRTRILMDTLDSPRIEETPKKHQTPKHNENRENKRLDQQWSIKRKSTSSQIKDITNNKDNSPVIPIVSPIKIINRAVLTKITAKFNESKKLSVHDISKELDADDEFDKELKKKKSGARRNLNDSLNALSDEIDIDDGFSKVEYSVIINEDQPNKIKLRVSDNSTKRKNTKEIDAMESSDSLLSSDDEENILPSKSFSDHNDIIKTPIVKLEKINLEEVKKKIESEVKATPTRKTRSTSRVHKSNGRYSKDYELSPTKKKKLISTSNGAQSGNLNDDDKLMSTPIKSRRIEELQMTPKRGKLMEPKTPTSTPGMRIKQFKAGNMTPTMQTRDTPSTPSSGLSLARERLHVSAVPKSLPCRETEFNDIFNFVQGKLLDHNGGCMYISGVPGTGKTATVTEVIKCLQKQSKEKKLPKFDYVEVNGMRLTEPRQAYVHIYRQMEGKTVPWEQALSALNKKFITSGKSRISTVLLVDELDILCTKRQDVVYTILDWPSKANSKLIVITIANTMDLPERLLRAKVTSRLGLTRRTFAPYSHKQLMDIVMSRLYGIDLFNSDAVQLVARKVAAVSGDARRALDICRRATEIAEFSEQSNKKKVSETAIVSMVHVNQALSEMITSAKVTAIQNCSTMEKIFLQAVSAEVARTGVEETTFGCVYPHIMSLCGLEGLPNLPTSTALAICCRLGSRRLLITEMGRSDLNMKILLNVGSDDLHYALQEV